MWAWCVIGLVLLGLEVVTGTLYLLWLGVAALCLAALVGLQVVDSIIAQAMSYSVLALLLTSGNYFYEKRTKPTPNIGQARGEEIGQIGTITSAVSPSEQGIIKFSQGVMGSKEWAAVSDVTLAIGERAKIIAVEGNCLRVIPA